MCIEQWILSVFENQIRTDVVSKRSWNFMSMKFHWKMPQVSQCLRQQNTANHHYRPLPSPKASSSPAAASRSWSDGNSISVNSTAGCVRNDSVWWYSQHHLGNLTTTLHSHLNQWQPEVGWGLSWLVPKNIKWLSLNLLRHSTCPQPHIKLSNSLHEILQSYWLHDTSVTLKFSL